MSTNAILRRTIKALCAPAVMATLAWHAPSVEAAVTAENTTFLYDATQSSSGGRMFTLNVLDLTDSDVPIVSGAPRPLQLVDAQVDPRSDITPTVTRFHNCITIFVPPSQTGSSSSSSSSFSITYTVADGDRNEAARASGTLAFIDSEIDTFTSESTGSRCSDPAFDEGASRAVDDDGITTDVNTPITIAVLENDSVNYDNPVVLPSRSKNGGTVQPNRDGTVTYTPPDGFSGPDTFVYTIQDYAQDGFNDLNPSATVTIDVEAAPQRDIATIVVTTPDAPNGVPVDDGGTFTVADRDGAPGESVTFDGSRTLLGGELEPTRYQWFVGTSETPQQDGPSSTFTPKLADGVSQIRLVAIFEGEGTLSATSTISVTVAPPQENPAIITVNNNVIANGSNLAVADTDFTLGETVAFDGSSTMFIGEGTRSFQWFVGNSETAQGTDAMFTPRLPDGASQVRLVVTSDLGEGGVFTATSAITVTVAPADTGSTATILVNNAPVSNGAFSLTDSDGKPGETPTFDGSQSMLPGGAPTSFQWFVGSSDTPQGTDAIFKPSLPDGGPTTVRLVVSNGQFSASSAVAVTVNGVTTLANIPGLTANQKQVALALDNICAQLETNFAASPASLTADQQDLRLRCQGILAADAASQRRALDELGAQDFNGARLQTLLFTNSLYAGVQDRLMALRGGAKGISLAGLNVVIDGKSVPLAQLQEMAGQLLGGGAAADDEPGSLLGDKWGAWSRGNFTFGEKDRSRNDKGFEADQFSLTAGLDYRLTDKMVLGGALAYGSSNLDYNPTKEGGLDTTTWAASIYGSSYVGKSFYVDALINAANSSYEADRRISYTEVLNGVTNTVQRQAKGDTDGLTLSGGLSGGYDYIYKGWTLSPALGVFYVDSTIDKFREKRSAGLNLVYDEQSFQSLTGTLGFRVNYAWNLSWGVLVPYFRGDYVREFNEDVEAFNVHFANDPKSPANTIIVKSDAPDQSYVRLVGGISGQFPFGISGYIEYQRLQGFEFVNFNDLSMGLRVQYRY